MGAGVASFNHWQAELTSLLVALPLARHCDLRRCVKRLKCGVAVYRKPDVAAQTSMQAHVVTLTLTPAPHGSCYTPYCVGSQ
jgi:hypothetical protein